MSMGQRGTVPPEAANGAGGFDFSRAYRNYVLVILFLVSLLNFLDRQIMAVLLESIRLEFDFSDTQLGLLSGLAFAIFYATLGIPAARLADKFNRRNILSIAVGLWSAMTAVCALAGGFWSLFLARMGVGVGESGGIPTSHSLISDYFKREERSTALAVYNMGIPLGVLVGFLVGGWVNEFYGWRVALLVVGLPGVLLAILIRLTLREPPRGHTEDRPFSEELPSFKDTLKYLWARRSARFIPLGVGFYSLGAWGAGIWLPSFFIRVHDMSSGEIGTWLAFVFGLGGAFGSVVGGIIAGRIVNKTGDDRWYMWFPAIAVLLSVPFHFFVYLSDAATPALLVLIIPVVLGHTYLGPATATMQNLAGVRRRAMAAAVYQLATNLVSMGLGPLFVGVISDIFSTEYGTDSLRYSILAIVVFAGLFASFNFFLSTRWLRQDLKAAQE